MKTWLLIVMAVAGCKSGAKSDPSAANPDCELIRKAPQTAVGELSKKYPNNAVKVAETIENCVAPPASGDECDRVAAIVKAIPTMSGLPAPRGSADYAATCRAASPEMRRCYLPSYTLAHDVECKKLRDQLAGSVDLPVKPARCDGGTVDVYITDEGSWVITGKDPASRCFGARKGKELDRAWLESELSQFKAKDCKPSVAVAAEKDVRYQDMIAAMDVAVKVGLVDTTMTAPADLGVTVETGEEGKAPQHCPPTTIASPPMSAAGPGSDATGKTIPSVAGDGSNGLARSPVIIITKDSISFGGEIVSTVKAATEGNDFVIAKLKDALPLPASASAPLILQADQDTSALVINRVVATAKAAGYDNVLFAVKNK